MVQGPGLDVPVVSCRTHSGAIIEMVHAVEDNDGFDFSERARWGRRHLWADMVSIQALVPCCHSRAVEERELNERPLPILETARQKDTVGKLQVAQGLDLGVDFVMTGISLQALTNCRRASCSSSGKGRTGGRLRPSS